MIGSIGAYGAYNSIYASGATLAARSTALHADVNEGAAVAAVAAVPEAFSNAQTVRVGKSPDEMKMDVDNAAKTMESPATERMRKRLGIEKCETCENRMYVDGSNESDVSFKTPGHIDPSVSASKVMAHEREHVANAVQEGNKPDAKLISASVTLHTSICPECGRTYVSGGLTRTRIKHTTDGSDIDKPKTE
ncbi:MAG: hypothetical protein K6F63_05825 [Lachnospiraceae bacterium]|nr:hypothetical protein [Lachnospiraceae bacterium]